MAIFQKTDSTGAKKLNPIIIIVIAVVVLLCCCCAAATIFYFASKGHPFGIGKKDTFLPLYLTLRTWL
jgi:flagellar basal body-associated protein FliL